MPDNPPFTYGFTARHTALSDIVVADRARRSASPPPGRRPRIAAARSIDRSRPARGGVGEIAIETAWNTRTRARDRGGRRARAAVVAAHGDARARATARDGAQRSRE